MAPHTVRLGRCWDINADGRLTVADQTLLAHHEANEGDAAYDYHFDLNYDGHINVADLTLLAKQQAYTDPYCPDTANYTYNGDGLRIEKRQKPLNNPVQITDNVWDTAAPLPVVVQEKTNTGSVTNSYVYGLDLLSATDNSNVTTYYLQDGLGSTTGLTSSSGSVTDTYTYDVFGATKTHTGTSANAWKFTGELNDTTVGRSPYYLRARYYDPAIGRFLSRDPFKGFRLAPQSRNRYVYNANDPVNLVDPYGLCGLRSFGDALDCGKKVGQGAKTALDYGLQTVAIPPYALYYGSYETARGINYVGSQFGIPGAILCHLLSAPIVVPEAYGLGWDVIIDWTQGHTVKQETIRDEGKEGHIFPRFIRRFVPGFGYFPKGGPVTYLPGLHKYDSGIDFEW